MAHHTAPKHALKNGDFEEYMQNLNQQSLAKIHNQTSSQELTPNQPHLAAQVNTDIGTAVGNKTNAARGTTTPTATITATTKNIPTNSALLASSSNSQACQAKIKGQATWKEQFIVIFVIWIVLGTLAWFFMLPADKIKGVIVISLICSVLLASIYLNRNKTQSASKTSASAQAANPQAIAEQTSLKNFQSIEGQTPLETTQTTAEPSTLENPKVTESLSHLESPRLYRFSWKRQFWGLIYLWFTLGTMMWFIFPPEARIKGFVLLGLLGIIMVASNYIRRNKPLPTAKQNAAMFASAMFKRILLLFTKD